MSQIRQRVEDQLKTELDSQHIHDVPEGSALRSGIADPVVRLTCSAFEEAVEQWLREWRSRKMPGRTVTIDDMLEDFRS